MPLIHKGRSWKFGKGGKKYTGKGAKKKAIKQQAAIEISKKKRRGKK